MRSAGLVSCAGIILFLGCQSAKSGAGTTGDQLGVPGAAMAGLAGSGASATSAAPTTTSTAPSTSSGPSAPTTANQPTMSPVNPMQPAAAMQQPAMQQTTMPVTSTGTSKLAMDECGLHTKWPGDEYCIKPPPADKGFQMHIGPSNYDNPESQYVMQPGTEVTETFPAVSGNTSDVYYYWRQYRMRPGSHHLIINSTGGSFGGFGGVRLGGTSNLAKDNPEGGVIAPENKGVGMPLAANSQLSNSLHYFNFTDKPIIKEVWVNFWYRDKSEVTEPTQEMFSMLGMGIAPGEHVLKHGACDITSPGRLLTVYGHVHAHDKRFSVWRTRGGQKMLVHESYDWEHPNITEFSSTVMNPMLNPTAHADGGFSGALDLLAGDVLEFECDIVNDTQNTFVGMNEAQNDEMCIMVGDSVGTAVPTLCTATDIAAN